MSGTARTAAVPPAPPARSMRRIGPLSATFLVIANMIGAGVFTTSGFALADLGTPARVLAAWLCGGLIAMSGALVYGALGRRMPESGGEYYFLSRVFHPFLGFLAGWVSLLAGFTAPAAAAALAMQAYLGPFLGIPGRPEWTATVVIAAGALAHGLRLGYGIAVQNVAVAIKLVVIVAFVAAGAAALPQARVSIPPEVAGGFDVGAFAVTLVWISFAYSGWNAAVYVAGEIRAPERNLNRSLWIATTIVAAAYVGLNAVFVYAAPVSALAGRADVGVVAAQALGGSGLTRVLAALIALALFTSVSSLLMAGPRVYARMADDGLFPRWFASRGEVPQAAVLLQAALSIAVVWLTGLAALLGYIGFTLGLCTALTVVAALVLRRREGPERVPIPGHPWLPLLFLCSTLAATVFMVLRRPSEAAVGLLTAASAVPAYWWLARGRPLTGRGVALAEAPAQGSGIVGSRPSTDTSAS